VAGRKKVGVLAVQGDFEAHRRSLERAGAEAVEVRRAADLEQLDGLVIPGGESTTMLRILQDEGMIEPLRRFGERRPVFGTCAGAILLAREVSNPPQASLALMDIGIERNAYGRQLESRITALAPEPGVDGGLGTEPVETVLIRAPIIRRVGPNARVYLRYGSDPVLVSEGRHLAATFHPELTGDARIHRLFLDRL
jgi:5'-phosphate synthase pdxT subunit